MRRFVFAGLDVALFVASGLAAFLLRFEFAIPAQMIGMLAYAVPIWVLSKSAAFFILKLHRGGWRYTSTADIVRLGIANALGSLGGAAVILIATPPGFPRSLYPLDFLLSLSATAALRLTARLLLEGAPHQGFGKRTFIYGAGDAGVMLLRECRLNRALGYEISGFVDDNPNRAGSMIHGVPVLGPGRNLPTYAAKRSAEQILIAIPSATGQEMTEILQHCHAAGLPCKTVPGIGEIIKQNGLANQIREVAVEDLLGRTPVRLEENQIRGTLQGKVVLVTGAAGSIGAELCRQIAPFHPAGIVGFEIAESPLFEIDREMRQTFPETPFYPEIGSIQNRARLAEVFRQYSPSVVYHAAAYKHVPMMEAQLFEAIENNVFGTFNVAAVAEECGVEDFVLISSDKAVRPANVMGATKRLAELLLLSLSDNYKLQATGYKLEATIHNPQSTTHNLRTRFVSVRFGNVLGSSGSVIPIFKRQLAAGGPLTVTHPDMRRFFMTIPEACQLVLQASAMSRGGEVFVLDMGQPIKILDLARNLILLSGLRPDQDIKIEFTGIRPGEKLYEELSTILEDTLPTGHEKIRIFAGNGLPSEHLTARLELLRQLCDSRDASRLILELKDLIPDYNPSAHLLRRLLSPPRPPRETVSSAPSAASA